MMTFTLLGPDKTKDSIKYNFTRKFQLQNQEQYRLMTLSISRRPCFDLILQPRPGH